VVLDADLASDCRVRDFEKTFPDRFIENGIAEQDMVSMAGSLARQGLLPVVNSFGVFLAARANEQIFNNVSERTKVIYACHFAGLLPAAPGASHQSIRDISLFSSLPACTVMQPATPGEAAMVTEYCILEAEESCMIRLLIGPSPAAIELPADYELTFGQGVILGEGEDGVMFAYGPTMLNEALKARTLLAEQGYGLRVVNLPWLNKIDIDWLSSVIDGMKAVFVLDDHSPAGGLGDFIASEMGKAALFSGQNFTKFAVEGYAACGTAQEVLAFHGLDGQSLSNRVLKAVSAD